jgi:hypothetical protein
MIVREDTVFEALRQLYPAVRPLEIPYISGEFERERARHIALRESEEFHRIAAKLEVALPLAER